MFASLNIASRTCPKTMKWETDIGVCVPYPRYRFGGKDAEAPGSVFWRVELPAAEVELIRQRGGEDHADHIQVVRLLRYMVTVPKTLRYLG